MTEGENNNKEIDYYSRMDQEVKVTNTASILSEFLRTHHAMEVSCFVSDKNITQRVVASSE